MKEVSVCFNLVVVELSNELHVDACTSHRTFHSSLVLTLAVVQVLPRRELRTHGGAYQKDRFLFAEKPACFLTLVAAAEVPGLAAVRIDDRQVKGEPRCKLPVPPLLDLLRDPWWRVYF